MQTCFIKFELECVQVIFLFPLYTRLVLYSKSIKKICSDLSVHRLWYAICNPHGTSHFVLVAQFNQEIVPKHLSCTGQ